MIQQHIPRWKYLLSYLWEIHIESAPSPVNPHLYLSLVRGRLQLSTANAVYSFQDKYDNFAATLKMIDWTNFRPQTCLILGYGLGSIPYIFEAILGNTSLRFTGVEKDESVIYLYEKYQSSEIKSPVELILADADHFLQTASERYDLICMDVFLDNVIPGVFEHPEFIQKLKSSLTESGLLLYNRLSVSKNDDVKNERFGTNFREVFPEGEGLSIKGNMMFVSDLNRLLTL